MALTVEDGTGKTDADSYLSVADTDTYHTNHSASADWSGATESAKEQALRLATQYLDVRFVDYWQGWRTNQTQSLAWPRTGVIDSDEFVIENDEMPVRLKNAVAELALRVIQGDTLLADIDEPGDNKVEDIQVGPIKINAEFLGCRSQTKKYPLIEGLIRPLTKMKGSLERG